MSSIPTPSSVPQTNLESTFMYTKAQLIPHWVNIILEALMSFVSMYFSTSTSEMPCQYSSFLPSGLTLAAGDLRKSAILSASVLDRVTLVFSSSTAASPSPLPLFFILEPTASFAAEDEHLAPPSSETPDGLAAL